MSHLSWNEIQDRATELVSKYKGETYEKGESQSFWSDFLAVYGIDRKRHGAYFEYAVKKISGAQGFVDMFWPGKLLAEQKSGGRDLSKASVQAFEYLDTMPDYDLPVGIIISDFETFQYIDLDTREITNFTLEQFPKNVRLFGFLIEQQSRKLAEEDPVNRKAAEAMASLHNTLRDSGYTGHELELFLVRLVFCMFADDSGIFEHRTFERYMYDRTEIDGTDFGPRLNKLFEVLNTKEGERSTALDEDLHAFPYINGGLFAETTKAPDFNYSMRDALLKAMELDWSQVSPAIFGSMFQGVMDEKQRRNLGAHYTSEINILKVIKPLFLDDLYAEFAQIRHQKKKLAEFHDNLAKLTFLDPACGCGNFLVITYRELRRLEHKVLEALHGKNMGMFDVGEHGLVKCDVDQMYGIEIEEFPSLIAETALWLTDHQMNNEFSKQTGQTYKRIPLVKHANVHNANALTIDWVDVIEPANLNYILGNPPFIGSKMMTPTMRNELRTLFDKTSERTGVLDFVCAWYVKSADLMSRNPHIRAALVSTNSISQGEQPAILWLTLFRKQIKIDFAHRTFKWSNDAKGNAAVYCVIIGFSHTTKNTGKKLFEYNDIKGEPIEVAVDKINPYLIEADNIFVASRSKPLCDVPKMVEGITALDKGGNLRMTETEYLDFIEKEPGAKKWIKPWITGQSFLNNENNYCLWMAGISPQELRSMPLVMERVQRVRREREASEYSSKFADKAWLFRESVISEQYIILPKTSSENREYIPLGFIRNAITSNTSLILPNANKYHFGILTSLMHMTWVRVVAGRLKSDYRYSKDIVYNNFIWPEVTAEKQLLIEQLAQNILDTRARYPKSSLADLYDPLTMPPDLGKDHKALDKAVDKLYQPEPFKDDIERVALLFKLYKLKIRD